MESTAMSGAVGADDGSLAVWRGGEHGCGDDQATVGAAVLAVGDRVGVCGIGFCVAESDLVLTRVCRRSIQREPERSVWERQRESHEESGPTRVLDR